MSLSTSLHKLLYNNELNGLSRLQNALHVIRNLPICAVETVVVFFF